MSSGTALSGIDLNRRTDWRVERHGGRTVDSWRCVYAGPEAGARKKYVLIALRLRQGSVVLRGPTGDEVARTGSPRLRSRW